MNNINELWQLVWLAKNKKSVIAASGPFSSKPFPAAFVINLQGRLIQRLFDNGLRVYEPKTKEVKHD